MRALGVMRGLGVLFVMAAVMMLVGCKPKSYIPVTQLLHDSIRTEVRTETVYVKDTAYIKIPVQTAQSIVPDTLKSSLENDFATSDAWVTPDGMLHHTLETKPQEMPFEYDKKIEKQDSTTDKTGMDTIVKTKYVEKELTWWEETRLITWYVLAATIVAVAVRKLKIKS
jgi:hypothetical protein